MQAVLAAFVCSHYDSWSCAERPFSCRNLQKVEVKSSYVIFLTSCEGLTSALELKKCRRGNTNDPGMLLYVVGPRQIFWNDDMSSACTLRQLLTRRSTP